MDAISGSNSFSLKLHDVHDDTHDIELVCHSFMTAGQVRRRLANILYVEEKLIILFHAGVKLSSLDVLTLFDLRLGFSREKDDVLEYSVQRQHDDKPVKSLSEGTSGVYLTSIEEGKEVLAVFKVR
jgi:hypothetical protein